MSCYDLRKKSGFVLFAKRPGMTSFSSLFTIKHALKTKKVGHTGTLDSFAEGLLVVCVGSATRLASRITAFDKEYEAVISFGKETDTLDPEGTVIKEKDLPSENQLKDALKHFSGEIFQKPPDFSAIHVNGKRASDLVRSGVSVEIPTRKVFIYQSELLETKLNSEKKVEFAKIRFLVSKGTYIRSLARDIGEYCDSAAYLIGLRRTKVGVFNLKDAVGYDELSDFSLNNVISLNDNIKNEKIVKEQNCYKEIKSNIIPFSIKFAKKCGFIILYLKKEFETDFFNGKQLNNDFFNENLVLLNYKNLSENYIDELQQFAVFNSKAKFCGIIQKENNKLFYCCVIKC